ncbi:MAG: Maf family nucleotide pyrophosphatase [Chitinophagaceae bacterium]
MNKIVLASQSPRRKQLLELAEIPFEVIVSATDETYPEHLTLNEIPIYIAAEKANAVYKKIVEENKEAIIIAADTVVVLDEKIIGKPVDRNDAIEILQSLSGKTHRVITGVVIKQNEQIISFSDTTFVTFNSININDISHYVDTYQPFDKAGAYAIQEWIGVIGISKIEGDFYNVMGLPISRVVSKLQSLKTQ